MPVIKNSTCLSSNDQSFKTADPSALTREQLLACVDVGKALTAELRPDKLIAAIMERVSNLLPSETWSLLLFDDATQMLKFEISMDIDPSIVKDVRLALGQGVAGQAALTQRLILVEDVSRCEFFFAQVDSATGRRTSSLICVPMLAMLTSGATIMPTRIV